MSTSYECIICMNPMRNPVSIPCGHIFCSGCLIGYTNSFGGRGAVCRCPSCRAMFTYLTEDDYPENIHSHPRHLCLPPVRKIFCDFTDIPRTIDGLKEDVRDYQHQMQHLNVVLENMENAMETQTLVEQEVRSEADRLRSETGELRLLVNELVSRQATQHGEARIESDRSQEWAEGILLSVSETVRQNLNELASIHTHEVETLHATISQEQAKFRQQAFEHAAAITALQQENQSNRTMVEQYASNLQISDESCQSAIRETEGIRRKLNECKVKFQEEKAALKTLLEEKKQKHKESVEKLTLEKAALETSHGDEIRERTNTHNNLVKRLEGEIRVHRTTLEAEIAKLKEAREADKLEFEANMDELNVAHQQSIQKLKGRHNQELGRVTEQREAAIQGGIVLGGIMVIIFQHIYNLVRQWLAQRYKLPA